MVAMPARALPLLLAALALSPRPAGALELRDPLGCPGEAQLRKALELHAPGLEGTLALARAAQRVRVTWTTGARRFTRELALSPSDCAAAADTVALLVQAWRRNLPTSAAADPLSQAAQVKVHQPQTLPEARPELPPDAGPALQPDAVSDDVSDAGPPPPPPDAGPIAIAATESAAPAPLVQAEIEAPPSAPEPTPSTWHLRAGLEGRGAQGLGASRQFGAGALVLELDPRELFGLQLDAAADTAQRDAAQTVTVSRQTASLRGLIRIRPAPAHRGFALRLTLGPLAERLAGTAQGFQNPGSQTVWAFGLAGGAAAELALGPVALGIGPEFELLNEKTDFVIGGVGTVLSLPRAWVGLAVGARLQLF